MTRALESGTDPFLTLLEWRNCPSEQLARSPVEILMGRRTRTTLPLARALLSTPREAAAAHMSLNKAKQLQAHYYDRTARERPPLPLGQTVRVRCDEADWRKAEVSRQLPHRSYEVKLDDETTRRRTSKHVRRGSEPPIIMNHDDSTPAPAAPATDYVGESIVANQSVSGIGTTPSSVVRTTRYGRVIRMPARFSD